MSAVFPFIYNFIIMPHSAKFVLSVLSSAFFACPTANCMILPFQNESSLHFRKLRLKEIADFLLIFLFSSFIYRHTVLCSLSQFAIFAVASTIFHLLFLPRRSVLSYLFSYISFSFLCSHISSSFSLRAFPSFPLATFVISIFI